MFSYFNTPRVYDMIGLNNMVFMFKVNNNWLPDHTLSYFERECDIKIIIYAI